MATSAARHEPPDYDAEMDSPQPRRVKVTVRLSPERLERARKAVKNGYAPSISAWVETALEQHDNSYGWDDDIQGFFDEMDRVFGPPGEDATRWARKVLNL
jgi:hypothetical protein